MASIAPSGAARVSQRPSRPEGTTSPEQMADGIQLESDQFRDEANAVAGSRRPRGPSSGLAQLGRRDLHSSSAAATAAESAALAPATTAVAPTAPDGSGRVPGCGRGR